MNPFALSVLSPCSPFLLSRFTDCFVSCFLACKRKLIVHITCREFTYFHILKIRITFLVQDIYQRLPNLISNMKTQFLHLLPFKLQHDKANKMTCAPSEDSDQAGHPHSMIRAYVVRMKKPCVLSLVSTERTHAGNSNWALALSHMSSLVGCIWEAVWKSSKKGLIEINLALPFFVHSV